MPGKEISRQVVRRLPRYYRFLTDLEAQGIEKISSGKLAALMGLTASQIRQDLNCFGGFGQQGYGYSISKLRQEIAKILGLEEGTTAIIVGAGNIGRGLASYAQFAQKGLRLVGVFDKNPALAGVKVGGLAVLPSDQMASFCAANHPDVAILCLDSDAAKEVASLLISLGITGFINFSHYDILRDHPEAMVENVHIGDSMMTMAYQISRRKSDQTP